MPIDPVTITPHPVYQSVAAQPAAAPRVDASRKSAASPALLQRVDHLLAHLPFPADQRPFAAIALRDLAAEFAGGRPDLSKDVGPGSSLGEIVRSHPVFAAASLDLLAFVHATGRSALPAYEELRKFVPPSVVAASTPEIRAMMNSFAHPLNPPLSSLR